MHMHATQSASLAAAHPLLAASRKPLCPELLYDYDRQDCHVTVTVTY